MGVSPAAQRQREASCYACKSSGGGDWWLAQMLLKDADRYQHRQTREQQPIEYVFSGKGWISTIRWCWIMIGLLGFLAWLVFASVAATQPQLYLQDSLARALSEDNYLWTRTYKPNEAEPPNSVRMCTCSYSGQVGIPDPPFARLERHNDDFEVDHVLNFCPHNCPRGGGLPQRNTTYDKVLREALREATLATTKPIRIQSTSIMLSEAAWNASRYSAAYVTVEAGIERARDKLFSYKNILTAVEYQDGRCHIDRLDKALVMMIGKVMGFPPASTVIYVYNFWEKARTPINCSNFPDNRSDLPFILREWCPLSLKPLELKPDNNNAVNLTITLSDADCDSPGKAYAAYKAWCDPKYCIVMQNKTKFGHATESLTVIGGVWSVVGIWFVFGWAAFYWCYKKCCSPTTTEPAADPTAGDLPPAYQHDTFEGTSTDKHREQPHAIVVNFTPEPGSSNISPATPAPPPNGSAQGPLLDTP